MYRTPNISFEDFLKNISEKIGIEIDGTSFDYDILRAFHQYLQDMNTITEDKLNGLIYENMKGNDLDNFLEFFNIHRIQGNNEDLYEIEVTFSSMDTLLILEGCHLQINGIMYETVDSFSIGNKKETIIARKSNQTNIDMQLISKDFKIVLDAEKVTLSNADKNIHQEIQRLYLISLKRNPNGKESDFEFLSRAKSVLQNFGYNNKVIIRNAILEDNRVKDVHIEDKNGIAYIIVYPKLVADLEDIISSSKHIVEYFKDSNIQLVKPNIMEINVLGLSEQLSYIAKKEEVINAVILSMKNTLNSTYSETEKLTIPVSVLFDSIKKVLDLYEISINTKVISFEYNYYFRENYEEPIYTVLIEEEFVVNPYDVVTEGKVI